MRNLSDMKDLYNAQDVIILCEIVKNKFGLMYKANGFNPRKCNSFSSLAVCIERDLSKFISALQTNKSVIEIFEKTVTGGFISVKTSLGFNNQNLMPSYTAAEHDKIHIDQSFRVYKRQGLKIAGKLKLDDEDKYYDQKIISEVLKLHEKNQYGYSMTKPLPCIKE